MSARGRRTPDFGPELPVTQAWCERVEQVLLAREWSNAELAQRIGVSASAISHVLTRRYKVSSLVRPISEILGIALPLPTVDAELAEWLQVGTELRGTRPDMFRAILETARNAIRQ